MAKDHDLLQPKTKILLKVDIDASRPHADGCVGCRRLGTCVSCASPKTDRCISGACAKCCSKIHKHVNDDRADLVMGETK